MERHRLAIVIPAWNESNTIAEVVRVASNYGIPIVVDDGSIDCTGEQARQVGAIVVIHQRNSGYDAALNSGFEKANAIGCRYVLTMDADGQHDPGVIHKMIEALEQGADVVSGIRDRRQRIAEHAFAWMTSLRWGLKDPLCGLKAYRLDLYRELGYFDSYRSIGTELLLFAVRNQKKIVQIAVKTKDRIDSPRFGNRLKGNIKIFRAIILSL
ncbi:MAG: glycosyltransferase family 2 protein [Oligoflexales bacterium]|nr:glycosyltransferase family 2 protein [Oligoflexales bacterium]